MDDHGRGSGFRNRSDRDWTAPWLRVKDLHLGTLVGTRTLGAVSGPELPTASTTAASLGLPAKHEVNADHEIINGIGVAPDYYLPMTAWDLSTGHDPDIDIAPALLGD